MGVLYKSIALVREDVDVLQLPPQRKVPQQNLVHLRHPVVVARQTVVAHVDGLGLFRKRTHPLHVLAEHAEPRPSKYVLGLVDALAVLQARDLVIETAVNAVGTAAPGKKEAVIGRSLLVEEVSGGVPHIQFGVALGECGFLVFLVLGADVLAEPEVVLLIALLVGVVVGETGLDLFAGRPLHGVGEGQVLLLLLAHKLLGDVLVDVAARFGGSLEGAEVGLDAEVQFLGQLPHRLVGLRVEVVVLLSVVVVENLEGLDQLVYFPSVHALLNIIPMREPSNDHYLAVAADQQNNSLCITSRLAYNFQNSCNMMKKRSSQKKLNGEIILMQTELMSKLASVSESSRYTDDLGFALSAPAEQSDALINLLNKSKNITQTHAREIQAAKRQHQRDLTEKKIEKEATFLTGLGLARENGGNSHSRKDIPHPHSPPEEEQNDPDLMLKELITKRSGDDLAELRRMIKQTSSNLQGCSHKLNKSTKSILHMADRYAHEVPSMTLNFLNNYRQFNAKDLDTVEHD